MLISEMLKFLGKIQQAHGDVELKIGHQDKVFSIMGLSIIQLEGQEPVGLIGDRQTMERWETLMRAKMGAEADDKITDIGCQKDN